jgi:BirA family biotin operon repressor/biotin-[acetyl-CoA-carboxylase] ligase
MSCIYKENICEWHWYETEETVSTNDEIKILTDKENVVLSAIRQTGGRGRRGRKWQSILGNLYFTYTQRIPPEELSRYVCLIGLSLAKTVHQLSPQSSVCIKWPNDVFLSHKKLSGILLENISGQVWAIGIGVNIVGSPVIEDMPYQATSLAENGIMLDRTDFLHYYLTNFSNDVKKYQQNGFQSLKQEWLQYALNYQRTVHIKTERGTKTGVFKTLDDNGYLILETEHGEEKIIAGDLFV